MRRHYTPTLRRAHPNRTKASDLGLTVAAERAVGGAEIMAGGHDPELEESAFDYEAGIAARAERGDLVVAVELLADAVAKRVRTVPEQLVEDRHVVGVERLLIAIEGRRHLGDDRWNVDVHCNPQAAVETQTPCFSRWAATRSVAASLKGRAIT